MLLLLLKITFFFVSFIHNTTRMDFEAVWLGAPPHQLTKMPLKIHDSSMLGASQVMHAKPVAC
jgi:hypothetical protein